MVFPSSNAGKKFFLLLSPQLNNVEEFSLGSLIESMITMVGSMITMAKFLKAYTGIIKILLS